MRTTSLEDMASERTEKAVSLLRGYLNKRMRVVISDGRVIDGNFLCTDKDRNMVLGNCEEYSSARELGRHGDIFKRRYLYASFLCKAACLKTWILFSLQWRWRLARAANFTSLVRWAWPLFLAATYKALHLQRTMPQHPPSSTHIHCPHFLRLHPHPHHPHTNSPHQPSLPQTDNSVCTCITCCDNIKCLCVYYIMTV